jgi:hypothetical protein
LKGGNLIFLILKKNLGILKSRVVWLKSGDGNTIFFHKFEGNIQSSQTDIGSAAFNFFKSLYSAKEKEDTLTQLHVIKEIPRFFSEEDSNDIGRQVTLQEVENVVAIIPRDKSPGPDGWTQELFHHFFDLMGNDLLDVVEESRTSGKVSGSLNATFVALIPKDSKPVSFNDYMPISLCNFVYKVISKIIASRLKDKLALCISEEQFGFLKDRLIFYVVGLAQECMHSVKSKKMSSLILKLDLRKAYDKVSWNFLRMLLIQTCLKWEVSQWIMGCVSSANFACLVNGSPTSFFKSYRGLRQGFPLSPLLFLLVVEGLSRLMIKARFEGKFIGIKVARGLSITHLLFVDDVLILGIRSLEEWVEFKKLLNLFCQASGMEVNCEKSCFLHNNYESENLSSIENLFGIPIAPLDYGMKYLGFHLKPNDYRVSDWFWLLQKIEKRVGHWSYRWLSLGGRLILIKSVLQNLPVYWLTLAKVPANIKVKIRQIFSNFLWKGARKPSGFHLLVGK